jgi:hypothetical protein
MIKCIGEKKNRDKDIVHQRHTAEQIEAARIKIEGSLLSESKPWNR